MYREYLVLGRQTWTHPAVEQPSQTISHGDLLAAVGMLLLRWGVLERDLKGACLPNELAELRRMRNLICHRLYAANVDPRSGAEPFIRCCDLDGADHRFTFSELQSAIRTLERVGGPSSQSRI